MSTLVFGVALFLLVYVTFIFVLSPLIFPHLWHITVPPKIPKDMEDTVAALSAANQSPEKFIRAVFDLLKGRYITKIYQTHTMPWILFRTDIHQIWNHVGSNQTCTVLNFILKTALVHSGRFKDSDITERLTIFNTNMHQYLVLKSGADTFALDPWGYLAAKADVGEYCTGFGKKGTPLTE
jgi:hypothetical protein